MRRSVMPVLAVVTLAAPVALGARQHAQAGRGCTRPRETIAVELSRARYPEASLHFEIAWKQHVPKRYTIARSRAGRNRAAWDPYVPVGVDADKDGKTDDRDEIPMAFTREGSRKAANGRSASHIAYSRCVRQPRRGQLHRREAAPLLQRHPFKIRLTGRRTRRTVIVIALRNGKKAHQVVRRN
jgi:hypothetical protein